MKVFFRIHFFVIILLFLSCNNNPSHQLVTSPIIDIQPFKGIPDETVLFLKSELIKIYPKVNVKPPINAPAQAFNPGRKRYRADSLIAYLSRQTPKGHITIGVTSFDISTTKGSVQDWGVMGLGYRPGNACIASNYRLSKQNTHEQLFKVFIHELGHTQNLPHCPVKTCFMRDAEGGNPTNDEKEFCTDCRRRLERNGWKLTATPAGASPSATGISD